jgi:hypothetical protein
MLLIGQSNIVTFKVSVTGSSQEPSARVLVGHDPALCFVATPGGDATSFQVDLCLPPYLPAGEHDLRVEVIVGGRVSTPINRKVTLVHVEAAMEPVDVPAMEQVTPVAEEPVATPEPPVAATPAQPAPEPVAPLISSLEVMVEEEPPQPAPQASVIGDSLLELLRSSPVKAPAAPQPEVVVPPADLRLTMLSGTSKRKPRLAERSNGIKLKKGKVVLL